MLVSITRRVRPRSQTYLQGLSGGEEESKMVSDKSAQNVNESLDTKNRVTLRNILFATDLSAAANRALSYAIEMARRYGAKIYAVHVVQPGVYPNGSPAAWPKLAAEEEVFLLEAKHNLDQQLRSVPHELIFQAGDIWQTLSNVIRAKQIDLLVLGTHGRAGIEKALLGSVAEKILRAAPCPVLTVGPRIRSKSRNAAELARVLYATDFRVDSLAAAPYAISLAREHRAQLILLNCLEDGGDVQIMLHTLRALVPFGADLRCEPICIAERGAHEGKILEVSEGHGADLIVLGVPGTDGHRVRKSHFQRSALYKIVAQATCPVLTLRA
jgi:nucleotide-binding universal stress UspA family protein